MMDKYFSFFVLNLGISICMLQYDLNYFSADMALYANMARAIQH